MKRNAAAWAAMASMALNALWPLLSGANPGVQDPIAAQVCTAHGMVPVFDRDLQLPAPGKKSHRLSAHCAFCSLGSAHAALDSAIPLGVGVAPPGDETPAFYRFAPPPWFLSASLRSRSPPA
jgi:Protein of unknown function (DUF2946)